MILSKFWRQKIDKFNYYLFGLDNGIFKTKNNFLNSKTMLWNTAILILYDQFMSDNQLNRSNYDKAIYSIID
jgi:hypothetical protein